MTKRLSDIFVITAIASFAFTFCSVAGPFAIQMTSLPDQQVTYQISDVVNYTTTPNITTEDYFKTQEAQSTIGLDTVFRMIQSVVYIYPLIVDKLHAPSALGAFIQGMMTLCQVTFLVQIFMRFGWTQVED